LLSKEEKPHVVIELPIRDGNLNIFLCSDLETHVIELPIRDGNLVKHTRICYHVIVIELPIRDGNRIVQ